jgi:methylmalonyl-CoA mutase N-terminal domain/subunit
VIVGVNRFEVGAEPPRIPSPDYSALEREQVERVRRARTSRDAAAATRALDALREESVLSGGAFRSHLMPLIIDAVRARATLGEISTALAINWGVYRPAA